MKGRLQSSDLRHTVTIRRETDTEDGKGGYVSTWPTIGTPRAKIEGLDGRESLLAHALQGIRSYRITIRWRGDILQADQITLPDGTKLNVRSASDPDGHRNRLEILADTESVVSEA